MLGLDDDLGGGLGGGLGRDSEISRGGGLGSNSEGGSWDYRTLPNKMLELVKNVGNMRQEGTGYFSDTESEMLQVLAYLNYGEKTNITDSMIEQIELAVKTTEERKLQEREEADSFINIQF